MADSIFVAREVVDYAVSLVFATRQPDRFGLADLGELVAYGASPRASLGLVAAGRALAMMRGRTYVLPQDVFDVAPDILRHRLVLSYEALARDVGVDDVLGRLLSTVPAPRVAPSQDQSSRVATPPPGPSWAGQGDSPAPVSWAPDAEAPTGTDGWNRTEPG